MKHDGNDLLRRQDRIEAIEGITCSMSLCVNADECHGMQRMRKQAVIELANMPAVQPDHNADIGKKAEKEDCISRQAALNAITDELMSSTPLSEVIRAKNRLKDLPSAQPDLSGYSDRLWKNAYERGKAEALDARWTPCSERLPEAKQRVLVTFPDGTVDIKICIDAGHLKWFFAHMVAWMPLPAPYKGGDAE